MSLLSARVASYAYIIYHSIYNDIYILSFSQVTFFGGFIYEQSIRGAKSVVFKIEFEMIVYTNIEKKENFSDVCFWTSPL